MKAVMPNSTQFAQFANETVWTRPYTPSLYWVQRVVDADRPAVEAQIGAEFHTYYQNKTYYGLPRNSSSTYYVVIYLYGDNPQATNASLYGYDLSTTVLADYMYTARDTGVPRATPAGDVYGTRGFFLFYPVYLLPDKEVLNATVQRKRDSLYGVITAFFDLGEIFADALRPFDGGHLTLRAYDVSNDPLFLSPGADRELFRQVRVRSFLSLQLAAHGSSEGLLVYSRCCPDPCDK